MYDLLDCFGNFVKNGGIAWRKAGKEGKMMGPEGFEPSTKRL